VSPLIRRLLPLVLLFAAQIAMAAHELDFNWHLNNDHCPICIAGHGLSAPPVAGDVTVPAVFTHDNPLTTVSVEVISRCPVHAQARAPPLPAV